MDDNALKLPDRRSFPWIISTWIGAEILAVIVVSSLIVANWLAGDEISRGDGLLLAAAVVFALLLVVAVVRTWRSKRNGRNRQ